MNRNKTVGFFSVLIAVWTSTVLAQGSSVTELGGLRVPPAGSTGIDSNATFAIGLTVDNGERTCA